MHDLGLFQQALGLEEPWRVVTVEFDAGQRRLDLRIDFQKGARFVCPECDRAGCEVHDTEMQTWRHLEKAPDNRHERREWKSPTSKI